MPFPDSVQALIAARLDTLEPDAKSLLADAAVIGKVFWAGAVAAMGDRDPADRDRDAAGAVAQGARATVTAVVDGRARRSTRSGMCSPVTSPTTNSPAHHAPPGMSPPPGGSSRRHPSGSKTSPTSSPTTTPQPSTSPRPPGNTDQAAELEAPALRFLGLAGERALGLDTAAALASFERALALTPEGHPERAAALARFGEAALHAGRYGEAKDALEEAIDAFQAAGDLRGAAQAMVTLSAVLYRLGDPRGWELPAEALALLEPLPPGPELSPRSPSSPRRGAAGPQRGRDRLRRTGARPGRSSSGCRRPARALGYRGMARCSLGDRGGLDDFREAIVLATQAGQGREVARPAQQPRGRALGGRRPRARPWRCCRRGSRSPRRAASPRSTERLTANTLDALVETGEHEQALDPRRRARDHARGQRQRARPHPRCGPCRRGS